MSASAAFVAPQIDCALCSQADLDGAADVLERCRIVKPVPGMPRPAFKPGACPAERNDYGDHWWSLDYALIVEGAKWLDFSTGEDLVENLSAVQEADGRVRLWSVDRFGASQNVREPIGSLPKFFETVPAVARMSARREIRQKALRLLERNLAWWRRNRRDDETGLFSAVFEETFVPNTTWRSGRYAPVDTNVELSLGFAGAAELAEALGEREAAARYRAEAEAVLAAVAKFCCGTDGLYYPYLLKERRRMEELKSGAMFAAFRVPEPTGNVRLLAALKGPAFGWDRFPITSVARTDKTFNVRDGDYRGSSSWQGATWTLMNDAAIRALGACGRRDVALELARKTIAEFKSNYAEFLNPDTGRGNGMLKYGWTAAQFIRILFEELYGLSYTAEKGLVCSPAPGFDGSLKGLRLPDGSTANVRVCAGKAQVVVVRADGTGNSSAGGENGDRGGRADWLRGSVGVSVYWTAGIPAADGSKVPFSEAVDRFDVTAFADALASVGAKHLIFTTAHGLQVMPMPNAALDAIAPGRTTRRDLFGEILDACAARGIRVIAYYNHSCNMPSPAVDEWKRACACPHPGPGGDARVFASNICAIVRCMSMRYGRKISGWWFDSSYSVDSRGPYTGVDGTWHVRSKNPYTGPEVVFPWNDLIAAARQGNPDAAVAINAGVARTYQCSADADYYAGETAELEEELDGPLPAGLVDTRWTTADDPNWTFSAKRGFLSLRRPPAELRAWTLKHLSAGRAVTFNVLIDRNGRLNPAFAALKDVLK